MEVTRKTKPVVASLGGSALSGGYYVASAADRIVARPGTITGSIGVCGGKIVAGRLLALLGLRVETAERAGGRGCFDPTRRYTDDERAVLERSIEEGYRQFVDRVALGRRMRLEEVEGGPGEDLDGAAGGRPGPRRFPRRRGGGGGLRARNAPDRGMRRSPSSPSRPAGRASTRSSPSPLRGAATRRRSRIRELLEDILRRAGLDGRGAMAILPARIIIR